MEYRLQSMYNHMVGRTASVVPPFYSLLPDLDLYSPGLYRPARYKHFTGRLMMQVTAGVNILSLALYGSASWCN